MIEAETIIALTAIVFVVLGAGFLAKRPARIAVTVQIRK